MATATATPEVQTQQQIESNTTSDRTDYVVGWGPAGKDGKPEPTFYAVDDPALATAIAEGKFQEAWRVTVSIPRAKNMAGIREICPDEEEAAMNFNRGAKQKANNRLNPKLTDLDADRNFKFNPETDLKNGVLDMTEEIASPSKRRVRTEEEKLDDFLKDYPEATRMMMKQAYLASRQQPAPAPQAALAG